MFNRVNLTFVDGDQCVLIGVISFIIHGDFAYFVTDDSECYDFRLDYVKSFQFFRVSSEGLL